MNVGKRWRLRCIEVGAHGAECEGELLLRSFRKVIRLSIGQDPLGAAIAVISIGFLGALPWFWGPFWTNDGPAHVAMARLLISGPAGPTQAAIYESAWAVVPNVLGYPIAGVLAIALGAEAAEAIWQAICLASIPASVWLAIRLIAPGHYAWVGVAGCFSLSQMFFWGLYNYILSLAAFVVCAALTVRAVRDGGRWWVGLAGGLVVAFLSHAGGLVAALLFLLAWQLPPVVGAARTNGVAAIVRLSTPAILAVGPVLLLCLVYVSHHGGSHSAFGPGLFSRVRTLLQLKVLAPFGVWDAYLALGVVMTMAIALALALALALRRAWQTAQSAQWQPTTGWHWLLALSLSVVLVLAFPDKLGGGWGHFRRLVPVPFLLALLFIATQMPVRWSHAFGTAGLAITFGQASLALHQHFRITPIATVALAELEEVRSGCTVLPLIPRPQLTPGLYYAPLMHIATRMEWNADRVALYNFLVHLGIYPVHYRTRQHNPMEVFFGSKGAAVRDFSPDGDLGRWHAASGVPVDYLFVQEPVTLLTSSQAALLKQFERVNSEVDLPYTLWKRQKVARVGCD